MPRGVHCTAVAHYEVMRQMPTVYPHEKQSTRKRVLCFLEQDTGVEPAFTAWEAVVLPIYESCVVWVL